MIHHLFDINEIRSEHSELIKSFIAGQWGSALSVSRGQIFNTGELPGFLCLENKDIIGLVTYHIEGEECEIVTLNSESHNKGLGTTLINKVIDNAKASGCTRVWLITTNDNTRAIRFYQKRGFEWVGFYKNSMEASRKLKHEIPELGDDGIPIKHEIEFELRLDYKKK